MKSNEGKRRGLLALCVCGALLFSGLGTWQIQRLFWKRDLIARVEARIHAPPMPVPARREWTALDTHEAEYRRVQARGVFLHDRATWVDALTQLGAGAWLVTPLATADGVILVNRGFVRSEDWRADSSAASQPSGQVTITGLLRPSEPNGRVLRPNDPAQDRWFSRDVAAIAARRGIHDVAPFFIDADSTPNPGGQPIGGLTVVKFRNAHLVYAITWFALAVLCIAGSILTLEPLRGAARA